MYWLLLIKRAENFHFSDNIFSANKSNPEHRNSHTRHDLKAIKSLSLVISYSLVSLPLLLGAPILNLLQYIDPRRVLRLNPPVLVRTEHRSIHCREIDRRDRKSPIHVEHHAPQAPSLRAAGGVGSWGWECGHGNWGFWFWVAEERESFG